MLTLRAVTADDYETLRVWLEDPTNNTLFTSEFRNLNQYPKMFLLLALKRKDNAYYMIENEVGRPLGLAALIHIDGHDRTGQLWYVTGAKEMRGMGVMTRAVGLLLDEARETIGLHTVYTWVVEGNVGSVRVLEKNGFTSYGRQREAFFDGREFKDKLWYDKVL